MNPKINRPVTEYDDAEHKYTLSGDKLYGISTVSKIGEDNIWNIATWWAWRIGYEGAHKVLAPAINDAEWPKTPDELREKLKKERLTPQDAATKAAERGIWAHDVWEKLIQKEEVPELTTFPKEVREYVRAILRFNIDFRPEYLAAEVQVTNEEYGFAGRYDVRAYVKARDLVPYIVGHQSSQAKRIHHLASGNERARVLIDLKTSKGIFPTSHYVQLAGYELGSVEMGFDPTDAQLVLNTHPDGNYNIGVSWADPEDFIRYLYAAQAIARIKANDPEVLLRPAREAELLKLMPMTMKDLIDKTGYPNTRGMLMSLKNTGKARVFKGRWIRTGEGE